MGEPRAVWYQDGWVYGGDYGNNEVHKIPPDYSGTEWVAGVGAQVQYVSADGAGGVYQGNNGGGLTKLNGSDGSQAWSYSGDLGSIANVAHYAHSDGFVYGGGSNGEVHRIDPSDGSQQWVYNHGGSVRGIGDHNGVIYSGAQNNELHRIDPSGPTQVWAVSIDNSIVSVHANNDGNGDRVYIGGNDGGSDAFRAYDSDGNFLWNFTGMTWGAEGTDSGYVIQ